MAKKVELEETPQGSKMAQLLATSGLAPRTLTRGETVEGEVVAKLRDSLLVDIGAKAEGIIPLKEVEGADKGYKVGDKISAIVAQPEGDSGTVILTLKKAPREQAWEELRKAADRNETLEVRGVDSNRGGLIVEVGGLRGFIPSSHLVTSAKEAIGKKLSAKVIEFNRDLNKLVFSEKEAAPESMVKVDLPFKVNDILDVKVAKILPFGLLVSLPAGGEGLIHISEISWKKVGPLAELYKVGQNLKVKVISIESASGKVNLSIKQLEEDPWLKAAKKYPVGTVLERKVSRLASYGVFVQLEEGIEGLLHASKIPYGVELKEGDPLKVSVDLFNSEQRRVALRLAPEKDTKETKKTKVKSAKK
jgi:small subunit ribosomal protein S1